MGDDQRSGGPLLRPDDDQVTLPYARAFVVHFAAETDVGLEHPVGRVEHLKTGCRSRFTSIEELLACIRAKLAEMGRAAGGGERDA